MDFNNEWCCKCVHGGETGLDCPILRAHEKTPNSELVKPDCILNLFIKETSGGYKCEMYIDKDSTEYELRVRIAELEYKLEHEHQKYQFASDRADYAESYIRERESNK
jgi:hypothetical protein